MTESVEEKRPDDNSKQASSGDHKTRDRRNRKDKVKPLTKVVIRRLPPTMTDEEFLKQIDPIPDNDYFYFVSADWTLGQHASARAYINFVNHEDIFLFKDKFDGYVFVDSKGVEYPAIVEFAPFQQLPKNKSRKKDNKCGSIESDPHFISFLAALNNADNDGTKSDVKMEYSYQIKDDKKITSTPLLEYIANQKNERREERKKKNEERKRQREDEKSRKKNQVMKQIPSSIPEEDDDGIIVRTVKSRIMDRDRSGRGSGRDRNNDSKQRNERSGGGGASSAAGESGGQKSNADGSGKRTERERKQIERQERRRNEREKRNEARKKEQQSNVAKDDSGTSRNRSAQKERFELNVAAKIQDQAEKPPAKEEKKEEKVKKYSELRRERQNRYESKKNLEKKQNSENENKKNEKENVECQKVTQECQKESLKVDLENKVTELSAKEEETTIESNAFVSESAGNDVDTQQQINDFNEARRQSLVDENKQDSSNSDNSRDSSKAKLDTKRIRNKDRPSLQIYQPGKRRGTTTPTSLKKDDEIDEKSAETSPTDKISMQKHDLEFKLAKLSLEQKEIAEEKTTVVELKKEKQVELPKPIEKKVSRYSERRNRTKERKLTAQAKVEFNDDKNTEKETATTEIIKDEGSKAEISEEMSYKAPLQLVKDERLEIDEVKSNVEQKVIEHTSIDIKAQTEINE